MRKQEVIVADEGQRANLLRFLTHVSLTKPLKITIEPHTKKRTLSQNALRWLWLSEITKIISNQTGNDAGDLNEFFKKKFLTPTIIEVAGQTVEKYTTKNLTTTEMSQFMDAIYRFAVEELQIFLPLPEEFMRNAA